MNLFKILDGTPEPPIIDLHLPSVNDGGDYCLATPMYDFQKELTDQIVSLHYPDILKYCELQDSRDIIVKLLEICILNCMAVLTHPYLLIDHYMPKNLFVRDMPAKLAETSGKFNVLKDLVNVMIECNPSGQQPQKKHIGVVMNNHQRQFDLVEALLVGGCVAKKNVKRYLGNPNKNNKSLALALTTIHLIPGDGQVTRDAESLSQVKFDVLIAFDGHVDTSNDYFTQLRRQNRRGEAVIIRLVPMRTIEHVQRFYRDHDPTDTKDKLYRLILSIVCLRDHVGTLPPDTVPIYNQRLTYLSKPFFDDVFRSQARLTSFPPWPLPELPPIPKFSCSDVERSLLTEVHFHYTPYDNANGDDSEEVVHEKVPTYYETKRLQLDYVTNPLKNDYDKLIGIHLNQLVGGHGTDNTKFTPNLLTHKLILQLNNAINEYHAVTGLVKVYEHYASDEQQLRNGRRQRELDLTLASINVDIDHAEKRIDVATKKLASRQDEIEQFKRDIAVSKQAVETFLETELNKPKTEPLKLQVIKVEPTEKTNDVEHNDKVVAPKVEEEDVEMAEVVKEEVFNDNGDQLISNGTATTTEPLDTKPNDAAKSLEESNNNADFMDVDKPEEPNKLIPNESDKTEESPLEKPDKPEESKSEETRLEEAKPEETRLEGAKPEETKPEETKPEEAKPVEVQSEEVKTDEIKPEETTPKVDKPEESEAKPDSPVVHKDESGSAKLDDRPQEKSAETAVKIEASEDKMDMDQEPKTTVVLSEGEPVATIVTNDKAAELISNGTSESTFTQFYHNQLRIWELQAKIKETIDKITARSEEKSYIAKEVENCQKLMVDSEAEIATVKELIAVEEQKLAQVREKEAESRKRFHTEMEEMESTIKKEKTLNDEMRLHLAESLQYLRSTPYMKKRKGRTPNK